MSTKAQLLDTIVTLRGQLETAQSNDMREAEAHELSSALLAKLDSLREDADTAQQEAGDKYEALNEAHAQADAVDDTVIAML